MASQSFAHGHSSRSSGAGCMGWRSRIHLLTQIDRSQQSAAMQQGSDPHTARVRSVSESTGACESTPAAGDCKRELLPRAAPSSQRWHSGIARQGHSRVRVAQVADAMRVRAWVAPRVASGDRAASKGKSAGGASFGKRRVEQEHRCAAPHARLPQLPRLHNWSRLRGFRSSRADDSNISSPPGGEMRTALAKNSDRPWCVCACAQVGWAPGMG